MIVKKQTAPTTDVAWGEGCTEVAITLTTTPNNTCFIDVYGNGEDFLFGMSLSCTSRESAEEVFSEVASSQDVKVSNLQAKGFEGY